MRNRNVALGDLSPEMRQNRAFMRVYWSGALYFLEMDIALHKSGQSLDAVVTEFNACCRAQHRYWNGIKLVKSFDKIAGTSLFTSRYKDYESDRNFRDYTCVLAQLGLALNDRQVVSLDDQELARFRRGLTSPN